MLYFGLFILFCFCTFHAVLTPAHGVYTSKKRGLHLFSSEMDGLLNRHKERRVSETEIQEHKTSLADKAVEKK